jgi:UDP-2,4-diacetamido-2,4,6-trideoxy-beta-L-altropyranose hydrolase
LRADAGCLFRVDAGSDVGFGHLQRCLTLALEVRRRGGSTAFLLSAGDSGAASLVRGAGHRLIEASADLESVDVSGFSTIVADISHRRAYEKPHEVNRLLGSWRRGGAQVIVIDGMGHDSLRSRLDGVQADVLIVPYAGAEADGGTRDVQFLAGPQYMVFSPSYLNSSASREIREVARRLLITFGGADPAGGTLLALQAASLLTVPDLAVRVVVGPGFTRPSRTAIRRAADAAPFTCEIVDSPADLADEMRQCDLAVASAGLTKYELAITGTPSILLELDAKIAAAAAAFARLGSAWHLGAIAEVSPARLADAVGRLVAESETRRTMSSAGRRVSDGRGTQRIIDAMRLALEA